MPRNLAPDWVTVRFPPPSAGFTTHKAMSAGWLSAESGHRRRREVRRGGIKGPSYWLLGSTSPAARSFHGLLQRPFTHPFIHSLFQKIRESRNCSMNKDTSVNKATLPAKDRASVLVSSSVTRNWHCWFHLLLAKLYEITEVKGYQRKAAAR